MAELRVTAAASAVTNAVSWFQVFCQSWWGDLSTVVLAASGSAGQMTQGLLASRRRRYGKFRSP